MEALDGPRYLEILHQLGGALGRSAAGLQGLGSSAAGASYTASNKLGNQQQDEVLVSRKKMIPDITKIFDNRLKLRVVNLFNRKLWS